MRQRVRLFVCWRHQVVVVVVDVVVVGVVVVAVVAVQGVVGIVQQLVFAWQDLRLVCSVLFKNSIV